MRWIAVVLALPLLACDSETPDAGTGVVEADAQAEAIPDATARADAADPVPACAAPVSELLTVDALMPPAAGSEGYAPATEAARARLAASIDAAIAGGDPAIEGYVVCRDGDVVVWVPPAGSGRAVVAWRSGDARGAILEVPHPVFDTGTLAEGVAVFEAIGARALIASGTHRCASAEPAGCDGRTGACGQDAPYTVSDMAHTLDSEFDAAHRALSARYQDDLVVSLHGFSDDGASVSDGTSRDTVATAASARFATALAARLSDERVTSCNAFDGAEVAQRLCGTTNVQGRHLNGSADACTDSAPAGAGRFIHLEQSSAVRARPDAVAAALDQILPAL